MLQQGRDATTELSCQRSEKSISVIIPVYRGGKKFERCLQALAQADPQPAEIVVVADGGGEQLPPVAETMTIRLIATEHQGGPAHARNLGVRAAKSGIVFFVDADVLVEADFIRKVSDLFRDDPQLAAVFGSYDDAPAERNFLSQYRNLLHHYVHQTSREDASTFWGACGAIRREVFLELGGFDEKRYRQPAIEDIELGYRIRQAGYKIRLCKALQIKHLKHWGVGSILKTDFFQRALPWTRLILQNRQFINDLNVELSSRFSVVLVFGLLLSLSGTIWHPAFWGAALAQGALLLALNIRLYRFFQRKKGLWFALKSIPWHWLYFFYSGVAFAIGFSSHLFKKNS